MENQNPEVNQTPGNTTKVKTKKSKAPIVIAIIAIIAILGGVFACLYFFTDLFKTDKQVFVKDITTKQHVAEQIEEAKALSKRLEEESYEAKTKLSIDMSDYMKEMLEYDLGELDLTKITLNETTKYDKTNTEGNIVLQYDNKDVISLGYIQKDNVIGLKVEELYDKYVTIENKNLKDLAEKYGIDSDEIPDKLLTSKDMAKALTITEEDLSNIWSKYSKVFVENLGSEEVEKTEETIKINVNGNKKEFETEKSVLKVEIKQLADAGLALLKSLNEDYEKEDLIEDNIKNIVKLYEDNGYAIETTGIEDLDIKDGLDEVIEILEENLDDIDEDSEVLFNLVTYSYDGKVIKNAIEIGIDDTVLTTMEFVSCKVDNTDYIEFSAYENDEMVFKIYVSAEQVENTDNKVKTNYVIGFIADDLGDEIEFKINLEQEINFKSDVKITNLDSSNTLNLNTATDSDLEKALMSVTGNAMTYLVDLVEKFPELEPLMEEIMAGEDDEDDYNYDYDFDSDYDLDSEYDWDYDYDFDSDYNTTIDLNSIVVE